jgi:beta-glucanase (GH16 family)
MKLPRTTRARSVATNRIALALVTVAMALALTACDPTTPVQGGPTRPPAVTGTWRLTFADDFDRLDASKWNFRDNTFMHTNRVENVFRAANVSVRDGRLRLLARREADGTITSGLVMTSSVIGGNVTFTFGRGYLETRARFPAANGAWPAIWLNYPGDGTTPGWPAGGEIDLAELYGNRPTVSYSNLHWAEDGRHAQSGNLAHPIGAINRWHTYGLAVSPSRVDFFYDGALVRSVAADTIGKRLALGYRHSIILNLAVGGNGAQDKGYQPGTARLPFAAEFDYVRVWQP